MTSDKTQLLKAYAGQSTEIAYHQDNSIHNSFSLKVLKDIGGTNNIMESVGDGEPLLHYIRQRMLFLEQHPGMGK